METTGARAKGWHPNKAFLLLFFWLPAPACLWLLFVRLTGLGGDAPGWLWLYSAAAPWMLLFGGAVLFLAALWHYWRHRTAAGTVRFEGATRRLQPVPAFVFRYGRMGLAGLVLSGLVLAPDYLPVGGLLIKQQAETRITRDKDGTQVGAPVRVLHCRYASLAGRRQERFDGVDPKERCPLLHWWRT